MHVIKSLCDIITQAIVFARIKAFRVTLLCVVHRSALSSIVAMSSRPVDLTTPVRPVLVPASPDSDSLAHSPGENDMGTQMANLPQIHLGHPLM